MLLRLNTSTQKSKIFKNLNQEFLSFLEKSITQTTFDQSLFSDDLGNLLYKNEATRDKFQVLHTNLHNLNSDTERQSLYDAINGEQRINNFFENENNIPTDISEDVTKAMGKLTTHLFSHSSGLVDIKTFSNETLANHYQAFIDSNFEVCPCCGTEKLTEFQANEEGDNSWRGPYDHLLPKKIYTQYGVHPDNLFPTCSTCNAKAKGIKDPIRICNSQAPCTATFPYTDSVEDLVSIKYAATTNDIEMKASLIHTNTPNEKSWLRIYGMKDRVENHFKKTVPILCKEAPIDNKDNFKDYLTERATQTLDRANMEPWDFWKHRLYYWISTQPDSYKDALWCAIEKYKSPSAQVFRI